MSGAIQISEAASIAIHTTLWLATRPGELSRGPEICRFLGFSTAHFAKVMQTLARAGLIESVRGPAGGTRLACDPEKTSLLDVYEAVEGPFSHERCLLNPKVCKERCCPVGRELARANRELKNSLADATLARMTAATDWKALGAPGVKRRETKKGEER